MGRRRRHPYHTRPLARPGPRACSAEDKARSASDDIPPSMHPRTQSTSTYVLKALQFLVPRQHRTPLYPQPQYAHNGPGWGGEGYPMHAYPPPGKNVENLKT